MACYDCADKFSFFKKEVGCANCGFGFCSKCCSLKASVPRKDNKVLAVCRKCHKLLSEPKPAAAVNPGLGRERSPPANFLKLVEQNNAKLDSRGPNLSQGAKAAAPDPVRELEERLSKLKERPGQNAKPIPNDEELASRLNQIKGTNPEIQKLSNLPGKQIVNTPDDLIKQFMEEVEIEKKHGDFEQQEIEKLEQRLKSLSEGVVISKKVDEAEPSRDQPAEELGAAAAGRGVSSASSSKSRDLVKKFLAEAESDYKKQNAADEEDDEIWCCLCNGDAQFRCKDCDGDYYCKRCYKQSHDTYEYKQHRREQIA